MIRLLSSLIVILLVIASCKKEKNDEDAVPAGEDYGCIERIFPFKTNGHSINNTDVIIANSLFSRAKIDNSQFRYYKYQHDTAQYAPSIMRDRKMVWVERGNRGLRAFNADGLYVFWDDTLTEPYPAYLEVPPYVSNMDTVPALPLARVRKLFRHNLEKYYPTDSNGQKIDYNDTCFVAEFGFYKKFGGKHRSDQFYKAWRVFKKNSLNDLPTGYYDDGSGKRLAFKLKL